MDSNRSADSKDSKTSPTGASGWGGKPTFANVSFAHVFRSCVLLLLTQINLDTYLHTCIPTNMHTSPVYDWLMMIFDTVRVSRLALTIPYNSN